MSVRKIDNNGDWTFGSGRANYIKKDSEIAQNVITRIKSFKYDYFLDITQNIDWFRILGTKGNKKEIIENIRKVTAETTGVYKVNSVDVVSNKDRNAYISINFDTINNININTKVDINA